MNAKQAIDRSIAHNEIVTLDEFSESAYQTLLVECDDSVEANGILEFWGSDSDGMEWRVHMPAPRQ